jgi:nicotinamidase-related amidase
MLIEREQSVLIVIDVQQRLVPVIDAAASVLANVTILMEAARLLGVPVLATEQYPKGLGRTIEPVAARLMDGEIVEKVEFSAAANPRFRERLEALARPQPILCGVEAHVCVLQTALELAAAGRRPAIVADAVGSRRPASVAAALDRGARAGVAAVTTEMVVFEWLRRAGDETFRQVSRLVR